MVNSSSPSGTAIVATLHWVGPVATALYYMTARTIDFCMLRRPRLNSGGKLRQGIAITFSAAILALFITQAFVYLFLSTEDTSSGQITNGDRSSVYLLSSSLFWAALLAALHPSKARIWHPFTGAWTLSFLFDGALFLLNQADRSIVNRDTVQTFLHSARLFCLLVLVGSSFAFAIRDICATESIEDTEPLLAADEADPTKNRSYGNSYGSTLDSENDDDIGSDDDDMPERVRELKKQQKQRLAERGNWLAYLKDFRVLLPLIWPGDDRYVLLCFGVIIADMLLDRALNVLIPRQMGILVDKLAMTAGTGVLPVKEIGLWILYSWIHSRAGVGAIVQFAELPVEQYSYRKIGTTSFRHIMDLSMDFHSNKNSGELIAAIGQGQHLYRLMDFMITRVGPMFLDLVIAFVYVSSLFDANMALIVLFVGVAYTYLGTKLAQWTVGKRRRFNKAWRTEATTQNEAINNWQTVSHFNRAGYEVDRYSTTVKDFNEAERDYYYLQYFGGAAQSLVLLIGRVSSALLAAHRVSQGLAPVGNFVTLISYWSTVESPMTTISYSVRQVSQMLIDSERLMELLNTKPSVTELPEAPPLKMTQGRVEFRDVDFSYDPRKQTLKGVTFTAESGNTVALVGETGGGKTTILKLLYRYYDTQKGSILIDGQNVKDVSLDSLRDSFGMVPQDPALFNISIMENVRYARLEATDEEVHEACRAAAIHDKILSFPDGYQSKVGERGVKLSGGELQRVAIARAILRNPLIVLLDEATSMIDAETESLIQKAFQRLTSGRTTFVVAHRLSTIQHADLILVVSNGEIIESGTHEELFKLGGKYVALWSRQVSKQFADTLKKDA